MCQSDESGKYEALTVKGAAHGPALSGRRWGRATPAHLRHGPTAPRTVPRRELRRGRTAQLKARTRAATLVVVALLLLLPAALSAQRFELPQWRGEHWFRGNTHTHTTESDGDTPPEAVARWYKDHGYNFLVLSDHNVWTDPGKIAHLTDSTFLLIPGEELTSSFAGKAVHVNGLNIPRLLEAQRDSTLLGTIQKNIDVVRGVDGVPHVNHPNFQWSLTKEVLARVRNDKLLEIYNGHPLVHNHGAIDAPGMEEVWDHLLTGGKRIYGIAVDDAHHFQGEFAAHRANPGRGWIAVRANRLESLEIMRNLEAGMFYASTGVQLDDVVITAQRLEVRIRQRGDFKYTTEFIGASGRVLATVGGVTPAYQLAGGEVYVRARVRDSMGAVAWVQPVFIVR